MSREPSVIIGFITAFAAGLIGLLVSFGLDLTDDQRNSVLAMVSIVAPLIAGVIIRFNVFSPNKTQELVDVAYKIDPPDVTPLGQGIQTPDVTLKTTPQQLRTQALQLQGQ